MCARNRDVTAEGSCSLLRRVTRDGAKQARVRKASAEDCRQRLLDVGFCRPRILVDERRGGENHARQTETALSGLFVDERLLKWMRPFGRAQAFERGDFAIH